MHPNVFNPIFPPNFAEGLHFNVFHYMWKVVQHKPLEAQGDSVFPKNYEGGGAPQNPPRTKHRRI